MTSTYPASCRPPTNISKKPPLRLSVRQAIALRRAQTGKNVFFTGPAGSGKSALLQQIVGYLRWKYNADGDKEALFRERVAVTASTGIAAQKIRGITLHSWAGLRGDESKKIVFERIERNIHPRSRWKNTEVLILDEISMIDGRLFDLLNTIGQIIRKNDRPFGGLQLIFTGDFCQLPPVPRRTHQCTMPVTFAFQASSWNECFPEPIFLDHVFRQKDQVLVRILNNLRYGLITPADACLLEGLDRPVDCGDGILQTELYPLLVEVLEVNNSRLQALAGVVHAYKSIDAAGVDIFDRPLSRKQAFDLLDRVAAQESLWLKVGALVMLIVNVDSKAGLINGSRGIVEDFVTIHDASEQGLRIVDVRSSDPALDAPQATNLSWPLNFSTFDKDEKWPMVRFENKELLVCRALQFTCRGTKGNIEATRTQVPLILAWALSIHKAQGQEFEKLKVNLRNCFADGQAYVALSRAKSLMGLQIEGFVPSKVTAHPDVVGWYRREGR